MKKLIFLIISLLLILLFLLLLLNKFNSNNVSNDEEGTEPSQKEFRVNLTLSEGKDFQINEVFNIVATLENNSDYSIDIEHDQQIFEFFIANEQDKVINSSVKLPVLKTKKIQSKQTISEQYPYKIIHPGQYTVWAVAKFKSVKDNKKEDIEIYTEKLTITVK